MVSKGGLQALHRLGARSQKFRAHSERIQSGYIADNTERTPSGYRADTERIQSAKRALVEEILDLAAPEDL